MKKLLFFAFGFLFFISEIALAIPEDILELPKPEIIMNRLYEQKSELGLYLGYLPVGALNKYIFTAVSYTEFYTNYSGWELINAGFPIELEASLKKALAGAPYYAKSEDLPVMDFLLTSNYVYSPFYTKSVLFNSKIVYSQFSLIAGGGLAHFNIGMAPVLDAGLNLKFFSADNSSIKFDFRYYHILSELGVIRLK